MLGDFLGGTRRRRTTARRLGSSQAVGFRSNTRPHTHHRTATQAPFLCPPQPCGFGSRSLHLPYQADIHDYGLRRGRSDGVVRSDDRGRDSTNGKENVEVPTPQLPRRLGVGWEGRHVHGKGTRHVPATELCTRHIRQLAWGGTLGFSKNVDNSKNQLLRLPTTPGSSAEEYVRHPKEARARALPFDQHSAV